MNFWRVLFLGVNFFGSIFSYDDVKLVFPPSFHKGVGISAYQNGGWRLGTSNWSEFEKIKKIINAKTFFSSPIKNHESVGYACGFWDNIFNDIALLKELGCNALRFSFEWSEIEPVEGEFNEEILDFYDRLITVLIENNITPMITLYHFVHPYWFECKGGFENAENTYYFVRYCAKVFQRFGQRVKFWGTINEPTVVAACGYVLGIHPPGRCFQFNVSGTVLLNLLNAHVAVYKTLKALPHGANAQVGLIHQVLQAESYDQCYASHRLWGALRNMSGKPFAWFLNKAFAHDVVLKFLKTGHFHYQIPMIANVEYYNCDAASSYDFIGLNFYSKVVFGPLPTAYPQEFMTDMDYASRPEKLYNAIMELSELGKPIYITENGIADSRDNRREEFIKQHISIVHKAVQDGFDVRGYYYWTLMDNFEWNDGYSMKFGLYHVDFLTQQRTLRDGAVYYRDKVMVSH